MAISVETDAPTKRSAADLAAAIRSGELTSRSVVEAHVNRLREVNPRINAVVCDRYDAALADADAADERIAATAPSELAALPPLLGVPCTIKESIAVQGMPNSTGVLARRDFRSSENAPVVDRVLAAGAIPIGVTNTSQLTMWVESNNRLYGRTNNPYDQTRTAGGSSGGEGAAVGSGGSPFGIGSDIGGSIRLPSFFNGVFGHKPSQGVVPNTGQWPVDHGDGERMLAMGPICRRAEDLMPLLRTIAGPDGQDFRAREVTLGDPAAVDFSQLEVVIASHSTLLPFSAETRAVRDRAAEALVAAGATLRVEPFKNLRRALESYGAMLGTTENPRIIAASLVPEGEPPLSFRAAMRARKTDHTRETLMMMAGEGLNKYMPQGRARKMIAAGETMRREFEETLGGGLLIHPTFPQLAPRHGAITGRLWKLVPAMLSNLFGTPSTAIPMGLSASGLPTGVQAVARRDNDHITIAAAIELERAFGGWTPPAI